MNTVRPNLRPLPGAPRVSVITFCKNCAWCIEECIESVLAQDYPNIEYLIQDGGSSDGTLEVLKKYEARAAIRSEPDRGPIDGFHKALARATGDIFCMLLSDERFSDSTVVSRVVGAFQKNPESGAIYGDYRVVDAQYREIRLETKRQVTFEQILCHEEFIAPCAAFVRSDTLKETGKLRPDLRSFFDVIGDYGLWVYVGSRYPVTYVPGILADFMVHSGEISHGLTHCQAYIRECETAIASFQSDAYTPSALAALKTRALARVYLNFGNTLAGKYFAEPIRMALKGVRLRPRLLLSKTFLAVLIKSTGLYSHLPARADGRRMKQPVSRRG